MSPTARGALAVLLAVAAAAACIRLGTWQLDRLATRRARNAQVETALRLPPLELADSLASVVRAPARFLYRRVRVRGRYLPSGEIVLRGRSDGGAPGVHLVTPLLVSGDTAVLVDRGWVAAADAATVDPLPYGEAGERGVEGILLEPSTEDPAGSPLPIQVGERRIATFASLPLDSLRASSEHSLLPLYVQQLSPPAPAGGPRRAALPELGEGPHLGYAVQWFSFAIVALGGLAIVLLRGRRRGTGEPSSGV